MTNETRLSKVERLLLVNQYRILALLEPKNAKDHALTIKQLADGYTNRMHWFEDYTADELDPEVHKLVFDVLDMFDTLGIARKNLLKGSGIDPKTMVFPGFDGNNESEYLAYTRYLLEDEGIFQDLKRTGDYNSHFPTLSRYQRMLTEWHKSKDRRNLTMDDLKRILVSA